MLCHHTNPALRTHPQSTIYNNKYKAIEDEIYICVDKLEIIQDRYMAGNAEEGDEERMKMIRDELEGLKTDYVMLVGAKDLPIYFGKLE